MWGSQNGGYERIRFLENYAVLSAENQPTFWRRSSHPSCILFMLVSCLAYSSIPKMKTCSSETSVGCQHITRRYIADDETLLSCISFVYPCFIAQEICCYKWFCVHYPHRETVQLDTLQNQFSSYHISVRCSLHIAFTNKFFDLCLGLSRVG
jgi:hypothetical protein